MRLGLTRQSTGKRQHEYASDTGSHEKPPMSQTTSWQDGSPMTFYLSKLRSLRDLEGMPPMVKEAQQWQFCDACGRKPLELVEIAVCLLLWHCCMPTRPRVLTKMAPAQECWVREGGDFQPLSHPRTSTFFSPCRSDGSTMFPNPLPSKFIFSPLKSIREILSRSKNWLQKRLQWDRGYIGRLSLGEQTIDH